jgi:C-terminal processing protease CtpA/Prc
MRRGPSPLAWMLLALLAPAPAASQAECDAEAAESPAEIRISRLAGLGRLWSATKNFHPVLAHSGVDWDAALVATIPKVDSARDCTEYAAAIQALLSVLEDPATRVLPRAGSGPAAGGQAGTPATIRWANDSLLVATLSDYAALTDYVSAVAWLQQVGEWLPLSRGLVFDLRSPRATAEYERASLEWAFGQSGLESLLSTTPITVPGERSRFHRGLPPQQGANSGRYHSGYLTTDGRLVSPAPGAVDRPTAFLVNEHAALPGVALALQAAGKAVLVGEGRVSDGAAVRTFTLSLPQGVEVQLRLGELIRPDGTAGFVLDAATPEGAGAGGDDSGLQRALELVRTPVAAPRRGLPVAAQAVFTSDPAYPEMRYPAREYRLLAAFRIWNVFQHFFPYRDLMDRDWSEVLRESIPRMESARDSMEYTLAVAAMVARVQDSHAFIQSPLLREFYGAAPIPVGVDVVEDLPVVTFYYDSTAARQAGLEIGDVIVTVDGENVLERAQRLSVYMAASTSRGLQTSAVLRALRGDEGSVAVLRVRGGDEREREVRVPRSTRYLQGFQSSRSGPILRLLPGNIGYADLTRLTVPMVDSMFEQFKDTPAIIFDMRGYPNGTAWSIAPRLSERSQVPAARFTRPFLTAPDEPSGDIAAWRSFDEFIQRIPPADGPRYPGRTVMLINEQAISQAEHSGLFFKAANGTTFVGSPTAGANGNITNFFVPGGIVIHLSGQGVRHLDGRQLQRVGLTPDVEAWPTIPGVRAGRDEVLERALLYLSEPGAP